ncbi:hypothetical protein AB0G06_40255 [Nonomuraea dietziae]
MVFFTGPGMRKAGNLRRDPRLALSIAPVDNPFEPLSSVGRPSNGSRATRHGRPSTGWPRSTPVRPTPEDKSASWS